MIRSLHKLLVCKSEEDFRVLDEFFAGLGLARGVSWDGRHSRGAKFEASTAGVEIGFGQGFPDADLVIETDAIDAVYETVGQQGRRIVAEIADQSWGARLFIIEAPTGVRVAFFQYLTPPEERNVLEGELRAQGKRFGIAVARFNQFITERLLSGALDALKRTGALRNDIEVARVPGSFELPVAARKLAETGRVDAVICLGCLLRGETAHYDVIVNEVTRGIGQSALETGVPHSFGVLTCDTLEQAIDRAGLKMGNKGFEAAMAAVEMADLAGKMLKVKR